MAVQSADIEFRFTVTNAIGGATAGDATAGTAAGSLGEYVSTTQMVSGTLHNLFDVVTGAENAASDIEYRCFAVVNTNATDTWNSVDFYVASQVTGGATVAVGLDPAGVVASGLGSPQGAVVANEGTAPSGVTFNVPAIGSPLSIGNMGPLTAQLIWVRRTANNTGSVSNDGAVLTLSGSA